MNIKEAAELAYTFPGYQSEYIQDVTHYLDYMKSQGYAMLKVGGDVDDIYNNALELGQKAAMTNMEQGAMIDAVTKVWMDALKQALTIGEERGRRFAEWASGKGWEWDNYKKKWGRYKGRSEWEWASTSELWEIAEREGIFNDLNGKG